MWKHTSCFNRSKVLVLVSVSLFTLCFIGVGLIPNSAVSHALTVWWGWWAWVIGQGRWQRSLPFTLLCCGWKQLAPFPWTIHCLDLCHVHDNTNTLLSLRYCKIVNTFTSLLHSCEYDMRKVVLLACCPQLHLHKWRKFKCCFCSVCNVTNKCHKCHLECVQAIQSTQKKRKIPCFCTLVHLGFTVCVCLSGLKSIWRFGKKAS